MATDLTLSGRTLGEFQLLDRLDEGAFGAVYRARQRGIGRAVVVKVLHRRFATGDPAVARFVREARLATRVDHPCVAHVYAAGCERDGLLWIAMELVQGVTLAEWLKRRGPMPLDEFVPFFDRLAHVVQAAHARGVVHRDLKPSNIMVLEIGGRLVPKLVDFGVAKLMDEAPDEFARGTMPRGMRPTADTQTDEDAIIGTWHYVAPELWLSSLSAAAASDLYALGIVAYEALTGRTPFRGASDREIGLEHLTAKIPSAGPGLPHELDAVFARALAKAPEDRYRDAMELAGAFQAVADGRIAARVRTAARQWDTSGRTSALLWRDEMLTELERWSQRTSRADARLTSTEVEFVEASREAGAASEERARVSRTRAKRLGWLAAALTATIIFGVAVGRARYETRIAQQRAADASELARRVTLTSEVEQGRAALLHDELGEAQRHLGEAWRSGDHSSATEFMLARALQPLRAELAKLPAVQGRMWSASWSPDGRWIATTDDRAAQIWDATTHQQLVELRHEDTVYDARWTADGQRLVTACGDGAVRVWDAARGDLVRELRIRGRSPRWSVVAVDGQHIVAADFAGSVAAAWDAASGDIGAELPLDGHDWSSVAFSSDGRWVAAGGGDDVRVFDTTAWRRVITIPGPGIRAIAWDPAGSRLITGSTRGDASAWDIPSGARSRHLRDVGEPIEAVAVSPDGRLVAVAGQDGAEQVFADGELASQGNYLHAKILSIGFDQLSSLVVSAGADGSVAVSEAEDGIPLTVLSGPAGVVRTAHFDPASRRVVGASWDGTVRIWDASSPYRRWTAPEIADDCGLIGGAAPDGPVFAVACPGHPTRIWDTAHDQLLAELPPVTMPTGDAPAVYPVATGDRAAIARGNAVEIYALPGGSVHTAVHRATVTALALGPDGVVVSGAADGSLMVGDVELAPMPAAIDAVALLADGRIAAADAGAHLRVLGRAGAIADVALPARARFLRPSPDGRVVIAVPSYRGAAAPPVLVDPERGSAKRLDGPQAYSARWVDGGRAILTAHADGAARLWDADGRLLRVFCGGTRFLADADLDGSMVVGGGGDGLLRFWDTQSGRQLWATPAHRANLLGVYADRNGVVTRGSAGELARWNLPNSARVIAADSAARSR